MTSNTSSLRVEPAFAIAECGLRNVKGGMFDPRYRRLGGSALCGLLLLLGGATVDAVELKLWPLFHYRHDAAEGRTRLQLLGPLVDYEADTSHRRFVLRPLLYLERTQRPAKSQVAFLYPLSVIRWDTEQSTVGILGVFSFQTRRPVDHDGADWDRRATLYPVVFYRHSRALGTSLSVLPFYADLDNFLGYDRIQMLLFPLYLHLEDSLDQRSWAPFPLVSWAGGPLGRGWRVWPLYGWHENGDAERFHYVLWPFYIHHERHPTVAEHEVSEVIFSYARIDSPTLHSRWYLGPLLTHTVDTKEDTETWGFPWPFWVWQHRRDTGERLSLRLAPFYQDRRQGNLRSRFYLWPLYRDRTVELPEWSWTQREFLFVIGRDVRQERFPHGPRHRRSTLFPLWRDVENDGERSFGTMAWLDALFPSNQTIARLYAPLWQVYAGEGRDDQPLRWSLLWDLIESDGRRIAYPLAFDLGTH